MRGKGGALSDGIAPDGLSSLDDGIDREQLSQIQRARILAAMVDVAVERGGANVTVAHVVARSGVSRRTFYEQFVGREECFLVAFEQGVELIAGRVLPAYERLGRWRERVRASLAALLEFLDEEPAIGRLVFVEALGAGAETLARYQRLFAQMVAVIEEGRGEAKGDHDPTPLAAEGVIGGTASLIHARLVERGEAPLMELLNPLMSMIVLPYLGPAAARRELEQTLPASPSPVRRAGFDSLRDLDMRLTYRTVRVLLAIGAPDGRVSHPSNRQVADRAGIRDQGQISKLLARLEQLGLIRNAGDSRAKGEANAWALTARGEQVRDTILPRASRF